MDADSIQEIIGTIYDAAYDRSKWTEHLAVVKAHTGSLDAYLMKIDPTGAQAGVFGGSLVSSEFDRLYRDHYHKIDVWAEAYRLSGIPLGQAWSSHQLVADSQLMASEIYTDLLRRYDYHYCAACFLVREEMSSVGAGVIRSRRQGPADRETLRLIAMLAPHQLRALQIDSRLRELDSNRHLAGELIDGLPYGVIALDGSGRVLTMNRIAEEVILAGDGLRLGGGALAGLRPREDSLLQEAVARASATPPTATPLDLERPSSLRPLRVVVAPVPPSVSPPPVLSPRPAVLLFLHDPERQPELPSATLQRLYGLTRQQARLAALLAAGAGLNEAAELLGVTRRTATSHLEQIFRKTGTHRQAELVRLLASLPRVDGFNTGEP